MLLFWQTRAGVSLWQGEGRAAGDRSMATARAGGAEKTSG